MAAFFTRFRQYLLALTFFPLLACAENEPVPVEFPAVEWISPNLMRIPFTLTGTLITVKAKVDTLSGNFIFDTGASELLLNSRYFGGESPQLASLSAAAGVTGTVEHGAPYRIGRFQFEEMIAERLTVSTLNLQHIEKAKRLRLLGLIGFSVFRDYEVIFDYNLLQLVLIRTDKTGKRLEEISEKEYIIHKILPIRMQGHIAMIEMAFGEKAKLCFGIDSGAEQNLLDHQTSSRLLKAHFDIKKHVKLNGTGRESLEVLAGILHGGRMDSLAVAPMHTLLTDLTSINEAYGTQLDGVVGYEFLHQQPVGINFRKKTMTFYRNVL